MHPRADQTLYITPQLFSDLFEHFPLSQMYTTFRDLFLLPPAGDFCHSSSIYLRTFVWFYGTVTGEFFPWVKWPGREAGHSPPSSAEVRMSGTIPPLPHASSWHGGYLNRCLTLP
jgi:hypothetical protein